MFLFVLGGSTGLTADQYRQMVKGTLELEWFCDRCINEITSPVQDELMNITYVVGDDEVHQMQEDESTVNSTYLEDRSFHINERDHNRQQPPPDARLPTDIPLDDVILPDGPLTFELVDGGTKRGAQKLVSSDGYTYTRMVCR